MPLGLVGRVYYVKNQSPEICLEAVKQNGMALEYVKNQTKEFIELAIKNDYTNFSYIRDKT